MNSIAGSERTWLKMVVSGASLVILVAPLAALAFGERGRPLENRPLTPFPELDAGWSGFAEAADYFSDRIPLRSQAIRGDSWIDRRIFGEDTAFGGAALPLVVRGGDGYLFLAEDFANACSPTGTIQQAVTNMRVLGDLLTSSGRNAVLMVAPNKSTMLPDLVPNGLAQRPCWESFTRSLWQSLEGAQTPEFINVKKRLEMDGFRDESQLYLRTDSHWNSAGSLVAIEAAVNTFQPGIWNDASVTFIGDREYQGDLGLLAGTSATDTARLFGVDRPSVSEISRVPVDDAFGDLNVRIKNAGPGGTLVPGKTLLIADSFGEVSLERLAPYFEDLTFVHFNDFDPGKYARLIAEADNVWVLTAERYFTWRFSLILGDPVFLSQLRQDLGIVEP